MDPMKVINLIQEIYKLADELGILDLIGDQVWSKRPEELIVAHNRLSRLRRLHTRKDD